MNEEKYKKMQCILESYNKATNKAVEEIIQELKSDCKTYKQVESEMNAFKKKAMYQYINQEKYEYLFSLARKVLEKEKNDLPITNRSES
ncbi:hypothetical protein SAMN05444401_3583 [Clostridium amylolyticum]|uniref:Uncharacterized protein n=1 Tax=Clostridium amylolyticum TaxID=1121298 RepID=A0A1M6L2L2_9CLOT|nr:hypothetical protein [Clostridium amylolyticum]SHJ65374.1 hypothetical protein SAMN05444401_3583 [Clostridium amylolyticum]